MVKRGQRWRLRDSKEIVEIIEKSSDIDHDVNSPETEVWKVKSFYWKRTEDRLKFPKNENENEWWELLEGQDAP